MVNSMANSLMRFKDRTVLVTGGGRGIGRAVALAFAEEGARVAVLSRTTDQVDAVADELRQTGSDALAVTCDVADPDAVHRAVGEVERGFGAIDVLVNAAGIFAMGPTEDFPTASSRALFDTNVLGTLEMCRAVSTGMLRRGEGRIINFASLLSFTAFPGRAGYAASKGAVLQLTRSLGIEWAAQGIRVNAVAPGMIKIETPHPAVQAGTLDEDAIVRRIPAGRRGRPADITGPVRFLASAEAEYITGQTLVVDGGWLSYGYL